MDLDRNLDIFSREKIPKRECSFGIWITFLDWILMVDLDLFLLIPTPAPPQRYFALNVKQLRRTADMVALYIKALTDHLGGRRRR